MAGRLVAPWLAFFTLVPLVPFTSVPCTHDGALSVNTLGDAPCSTLMVMSEALQAMTCWPLVDAPMVAPPSTMVRPVSVSGGGATV